MSHQPTNRIKNKFANGEQPQVLTLLTEPEELQIGEAFDPLGLEVLFGGGIVNPFGPTLTAVCAETKTNRLGQQRIIELVLNPFSQTSRLLGHCIFDARWEPLKHIPPLFNFEYGGCPTLLLPSCRYVPQLDNTLLALFLHSFDDARDTLEKVKDCPDDPFDRIDREVKGVTEGLREIARNENFDLPEKNIEPITLDEAKWLAAHLLDEQNARLELAAFLQAWAGSSECFPLDSAADLDSIGPLFARLFYTSRCSLQPNA